MRERVLADVRDMVLASEGRRLDVEEVASMRGMSRSAFSHWFKAATGIPPAQWITQVAMDEAVRLLLTGDLKLEAVARQTGFADANHFCKSFRRRFHTSPGEFRRQMR
jgi:AraC family transcriptional regulator